MFLQMASGRKRVLRLDEALAILEEINESEDDEELDLVLIPSDGGDGSVSDEEEGNDQDLIRSNELPKEVSGPVEVHRNVENLPANCPANRRELPKWRNRIDCSFDGSASQNLIPLSQRFPYLVGEDPIKIFRLFFDEQMVQLIIEESVRYSRQQNNQEFQVNILFLLVSATL